SRARLAPSHRISRRDRADLSMVSGERDMNTPRVGVVGVGHIGKNHARLYAELPSAQFTAIYDTDRAVAEQRAAEFGVKAVASLEEFAEQIDAASIATTTSTQFD